MLDDPAALGASAARRPGRLGVLGLAVLTFSCVAGGPFGIELAVNAAGAMLTLLGLVAAALLWGMPQALITAELSSAIPVNGGPVVWVTRALGARWGFVNCWLVVFQQLTDILLYPTLIAAYLSQLAPALTFAQLYGVKVAVVALAAALNVAGVESLSSSALLLTFFIMLPFLLVPCAAQAYGLSFDWPALAAIPPTLASSIPVFISTVMWNMQGWSEVGCIAGEVEPAVFPAGMAIAAAMVTLAYAVPVVFGVALQPDTSLWLDGYFVQLAAGIAPWLGLLVMVSAVLANLSTLLTSMAAYTRTLQAAARLGAIPLPALQHNWTRFRTPVPAILLYTASTCALAYSLDFSVLVVYDSALYLVGQVGVVLAFAALRRHEPGLARPYVFPGGCAGSALATLASLALAGAALALTFLGEGTTAAVVAGACAGLLAGTYAVDALPCGLREALARLHQGLKAQGAAAEAADAAAEAEEGEGEGVGVGAGARAGAGASGGSTEELEAALLGGAGARGSSSGGGSASFGSTGDLRVWGGRVARRLSSGLHRLSASEAAWGGGGGGGGGARGRNSSAAEPPGSPAAGAR